MSHFKSNPLLAGLLGISIAAASSAKTKDDAPEAKLAPTEKSLPANPDKATKPIRQKLTPPANHSAKPSSSPAAQPEVAPDSPANEPETKDEGPDCDGCILVEQGARHGWPIAVASTLWGLFGVRRPHRFKGRTHIKGAAIP